MSWTNAYRSQTSTMSASRCDDTSTPAPSDRLVRRRAESHLDPSGSSPSHGSSRTMRSRSARPSMILTPSNWRVPLDSAPNRRRSVSVAAPKRRAHRLTRTRIWERGLASEVRDPPALESEGWGRAPERDAAGIRTNQADEDTQQRGFARTVGADQAHDLATVHVHAHLAEHESSPVGFGDFMQRRRQWSGSRGEHQGTPR